MKYTIQRKAQKYVDQFEVIKIQDSDETRFILKSNATEGALYKAVRSAHGESFPSDFIHETFLRILERITEYDNPDLSEVRSEIVDSMVDIYTYNLTKWLHDDINNVYYLTEVLSEEYGDIKDGFKLLAMAQYMAIDEVYPYVQELLEDK